MPFEKCFLKRVLKQTFSLKSNSEQTVTHDWGQSVTLFRHDDILLAKNPFTPGSMKRECQGNLHKFQKFAELIPMMTSENSPKPRHVTCRVLAAPDNVFGSLPLLFYSTF